MRHGTTPDSSCRRLAHSPRLPILVALAATWLAVAAPAVAQLPDSRLGIRTAPLLLLSREDVRSELGLDADQTAAAEAAIADLYRRASALRGKPDGDPSTIAERAALDRAQVQWLDTHLSVDQRARLGQLDLQWEGPGALISRPVISRVLGLTDPQRSAITEAAASRNARRAGGPPQPDDERTFAEAVLGILDEPQRERWKAALGPPFAFRTASRPIEGEQVTR